MALQVEEALSAGGTNTDALMVGPTTATGDLLALLVVGLRPGTASVASVSGGGVWAQQIQQVSGRAQGAIALWAMRTSAAQPFSVDVLLNSTVTTAAAHLLLISGVAPGQPGGFTLTVSGPAASLSGVVTSGQLTALEGVSGWNTNGELGAASGGTDSDTIALSTTATNPESLRVVGVHSRNRAVLSADYAQRATLEANSGGDAVTLTLFDAVTPSAGGGAFTATLADVADWATVVAVVLPGQVITPAAGQAVARTTGPLVTVITDVRVVPLPLVAVAGTADPALRIDIQGRVTEAAIRISAGAVARIRIAQQAEARISFS